MDKLVEHEKKNYVILKTFILERAAGVLRSCNVGFIKQHLHTY